MELVAYKNHATLIPSAAESKLQVVSSTNRITRGVVQNSRIEGLEAGQEIVVSLDECVWVQDKLIVPESAILAFLVD